MWPFNRNLTKKLKDVVQEEPTVSTPEVEMNHEAPPEPFAGASKFGYASKCSSLNDVLKLLRNVVGLEATIATAAYGMALVASSAKRGGYREDSLTALDQLSRAKAEIDIKVCHSVEVTEITTKILFETQQYADEMTVPCTEWPSVEEISEFVINESLKYSNVESWRLYKYNENGAVIGEITVGQENA